MKVQMTMVMVAMLTLTLGSAEAAKTPAASFEKVLYTGQLFWDQAGAKLEKPMSFELGTVARAGSDDARSTFVAVIRDASGIVGTCERNLQAGRKVDEIRMICEGSLFLKPTAATFNFADQLENPLFETNHPKMKKGYLKASGA